VDIAYRRNGCGLATSVEVMKRRAFALLAAATTMQVLAFLYVADARSVLTPASNVQDRLVFRGGVVRIGMSIYLHDNPTHASSGIRKLSLEDCNLVIWTDVVDESQEQIIQADAEEDETLARLEVQAGISGGGKKATVYMYSHGRRVCANDPRFGDGIANLWIGLVYVRSARHTPGPRLTEIDTHPSPGTDGADGCTPRASRAGLRSLADRLPNLWQGTVLDGGLTAGRSEGTVSPLLGSKRFRPSLRFVVLDEPADLHEEVGHRDRLTSTGTAGSASRRWNDSIAPIC
jgi:hypothetical protein